jgi:hypothetical protein
MASSKAPAASRSYKTYAQLPDYFNMLVALCSDPHIFPPVLESDTQEALQASKEFPVANAFAAVAQAMNQYCEESRKGLQLLKDNNQASEAQLRMLDNLAAPHEASSVRKLVKDKLDAAYRYHTSPDRGRKGMTADEAQLWSSLLLTRHMYHLPVDVIDKARTRDAREAAADAKRTQRLAPAAAAPTGDRDATARAVNATAPDDEWTAWEASAAGAPVPTSQTQGVPSPAASQSATSDAPRVIPAYQHK